MKKRLVAVGNKDGVTAFSPELAITLINSRAARTVAQCNQREQFETDEDYQAFLDKCEEDYQETVGDFLTGTGRF